MVDVADRLREFGNLFASTLRKMRRPGLFLPGVLLFALTQIVFLGFAYHLLGMVRDRRLDALTQWSERYGSLISVLSLAVAFCVPAAVSGFATLAGAAVENDRGGWAEFWKGTGTYYGRVVGAYALAGLGILLLAIPFGGITYRSGGTGVGTPSGQNLLAQCVNLVGAYFFTPWIAAAVIDGTGVTASLSRGAKFAWANPNLLVPAFALQRAVGYLVSRLTQIGVNWEGAPGEIMFGPVWFVSAAAEGALSGYIYVFSLVLYISMYRLKTAPPAVPEAHADSSTSTPPPEPEPPPLNLDQGPEQ